MELGFLLQEGLVGFWGLLRGPYYALMGVDPGTMALCPQKGKIICCKHDTLQVWRAGGNCLGSAW